MPKRSHFRQPFLLSVAHRRRRHLAGSFLAFSRSVDWLRLLKLGGLGAGACTLLLWQWQLLLATSIGIAVMAGVYGLYAVPWQQYLEEFYRLWQGEYRRFSVSVLSGSGAVCASYLAIALWQSIENHWVAFALMLQGAMVGAILLLSVGKNFGRSSQIQQFEQSLGNLSHHSPVKRLYAIRRLRQLLDGGVLNLEQKRTLHSFLRLAWQQEAEPTLRGALLSILSLYPQTPASSQPLQLSKKQRPLKLERLSHKCPIQEQV